MTGLPLHIHIIHKFHCNNRHYNNIFLYFNVLNTMQFVYVHVTHSCSMDMVPKELGESQPSRGELSNLQRQLERSVTKATALQVELDKAKDENDKLEQEVRGLRKELTKKKLEDRVTKTEPKKKKEKERGLKVDLRGN